MSEDTSSTPEISKTNIAKRMVALFLRPGRFFTDLTAKQKPAWIMPLLVLSVSLALQIGVAGYLRAQAAAMGEIQLPQDWEWWTPEMQNNYMQAAQATQGPVFVYLIPLVGALSSLWLGWAVVSGLLHLISTLLGGRGSMNSAMNVVAWASLPFSLRDILRVVFMLTTNRIIASPGLSGFIQGSEPGMLFVAQLLSLVDVFFIWYAVLTGIGLSINDNLSSRKATLGVVSVLLLVLLIEAGIGMASTNLGSMLISRPFF